MQSYGIVQIDDDYTWFLPEPEELETTDREDILDAISLTLNPPHVLDGGFGGRAMRDIRECLESYLPEEDRKALHTPGGEVRWTGPNNTNRRFVCRL